MNISIALCTYNGEQHIDKQLNSILNQSFPVNEIIVCDDASTDGTIRIIEDFKSKFPDIISIYKNLVNKGAIRNFENAISLTTGDFIFLADQDDIWKKNKVEKIMKVFQSDPYAIMIFSNGDLIDKDGKYLGNSLWDQWGFNNEMQKRWGNNIFAFNDLLKNNNKVTGATIAFRRKLINIVIPFNVPNNYWHDTWLALHAAAINGLRYIDECLIQYRIHSNQQIGLPTSDRITINQNNFDESISIDEFYMRVQSKFPKLFPEENILMQTKKRLKFFLKPYYQKLKSFFDY